MAARQLNMTGGSPWGFTLSGGKDFRSPLKVSKITPGGKAAKGGTRFGDFIIEINGDSTENLNHSDAMMLIKTTGMDLRLTLTKEPPKSPQIDSKFDHDVTDAPPAEQRPKPPPPPANTVTVSPAKQQVTISSASFSTAPKTKSSEPKAQPSTMAPDSGLETGGSSSQQSPAFKRIHIDKTPSPSVFSQPRPSPPTQQMRNVVIDDGNVRKTSQRPQPPSNAPAKVTTTTVKVPKGSPLPKPPPPQTGQPSGKQTTPGKVVDRQGVCASCNQPIRGPFASAMGRVWHPDHFTCSSCHKPLQNTTFVFEEEKIICEDCYSTNYAQTCHACHQQILGPCVSAVGLHWHQEHFTCSRCQSDLSKGDGFNMENNLLFCADCFGSLYGTTCSGCNGKIGGGELWVEALDGTWHSTCFICESCRNPLEGSTFFAKLGRPYCKICA